MSNRKNSPRNKRFDAIGKQNGLNRPDLDSTEAQSFWQSSVENLPDQGLKKEDQGYIDLLMQDVEMFAKIVKHLKRAEDCGEIDELMKWTRLYQVQTKILQSKMRDLGISRRARLNLPVFEEAPKNDVMDSKLLSLIHG